MSSSSLRKKTRKSAMSPSFSFVLSILADSKQIVGLFRDIMGSLEVAAKCAVAAVVAVVSPSNVSMGRHGTVMPKFASEDEESFTENTQLIPLVLDQCVWGWT